MESKPVSALTDFVLQCKAKQMLAYSPHMFIRIISFQVGYNLFNF